MIEQGNTYHQWQFFKHYGSVGKEQRGALSYAIGRGTIFLENKPAILDNEALGVVTDNPLIIVASHDE